jgi:ABC-type Fe3+ transport system permease subunit
MSFNMTTSGMAAIPQFGVFLPVVIVGAVVLGVISAALSYTFFRRLMKYFEAFGSSVTYAIIGAVISGGIGALYLRADYFIRLNQEGTIQPEYYIYAIGGYVGLVLVGRIAVEVFDRLEKNYKKGRR